MMPLRPVALTCLFVQPESYHLTVMGLQLGGLLQPKWGVKSAEEEIKRLQYDTWLQRGWFQNVHVMSKIPSFLSSCVFLGFLQKTKGFFFSFPLPGVLFLYCTVADSGVKLLLKNGV